MSNVLETKIRPPRNPAKILDRPRIQKEILQGVNFRLTVLQAGAGYGKSTALAKFAGETPGTIWYQVTEEDHDPLVFLLHLCRAIQVAQPSIEGLPLPILEAWDSSTGLLPTKDIVYQLLNALGSGLDQDAFVVLDDVHQVLDAEEIAHVLDQIIGLAPTRLHVILSTRSAIKLPNLHRWRSLGQVYTIDQSILAFTSDEIHSLFSNLYDYDLREGEVEDLYYATEGWAITLQLIWQSLSTGTIKSVGEALHRTAASLESLFEILASETFGGQPESIQDFMKGTSILRVLTTEVCNHLFDIQDGAKRMDQLRRQDVFVVDLASEGLRYHPIFRQFLLQQLSNTQRRNLHRRAADYYLDIEDFDTAIYHLDQAGDYLRLAELLDVYGSMLKEMGRLETLAGYLDKLPPEMLYRHPNLLLFLGDLARFHSRFQEALRWYQQAEERWLERGIMQGVGRALRGQARVYLDTVNPSKAEELLQDAIKYSDGVRDRETHAGLYELLAENKLNAGKVEEAERLRNQAAVLRREGPSDSQLLYRVLLRTGRIVEARRRLEKRAIEEGADPIQTPRAHRETPLLLSLVYSFLGDRDKALRTAIDGTQRGIELSSPFVTAVGYMRQGHALMLGEEKPDYEEVRRKFERAIEISRELAIPKLRVEAFWGLCRAAGYQGYLTEAGSYASSGIEIATKAGDEWIASLLRLTIGASHALAADFATAANWLNQAVRGFEECSDPLGATASRLWLAFGFFVTGNKTMLSQVLPGVLELSQKNRYDFLYTRQTLLGLPDVRPLIPMLIYAREQGWGKGYPEKILQQLNLPNLTFHPGYQLRIQSFGGFQVWRGRDLIDHDAWLREKSKQLFQLMLSSLESPLDRDQIFEILWPGVSPETATRNFKVALNTLYGVLEPGREAGSESAFIKREGTLYFIRPISDIWFDKVEFIEKVKEAEFLKIESDDTAYGILASALELYQGEYLPDARYESWAALEREHLAVMFLRAADLFCELGLKRKEYEKVIDVCGRIIGQDNCWERAYRHMMQAYDQLGDHGQVARTYQRCVETLKKEIDVLPSEVTTNLFNQLIKRK